MTVPELLIVAFAGTAAGTVNTIVGSGSLITFPTLLALGVSPVVANVSNTVGLVPGTLSGTIGYRRELRGQATRLAKLGIAALAGGAVGAWLLLVLPATAFESVVPYFILAACALVALQPRLTKVVGRRERRGSGSSDRHRMLVAAVFLSGVYGGYFGAAQGVLLIAVLGVFIADDLQRLNGLKNALVLTVNAIAACIFVLTATVAWDAVAAIAAGSIAGGQIGAAFGRRLPGPALRVVVISVGAVVALVLVLR